MFATSLERENSFKRINRSYAAWKARLSFLRFQYPQRVHLACKVSAVQPAAHYLFIKSMKLRHGKSLRHKIAGNIIGEQKALEYFSGFFHNLPMVKGKGRQFIYREPAGLGRIVSTDSLNIL